MLCYNSFFLSFFFFCFSQKSKSFQILYLIEYHKIFSKNNILLENSTIKLIQFILFSQFLQINMQIVQELRLKFVPTKKSYFILLIKIFVTLLFQKKKEKKRKNQTLSLFFQFLELLAKFVLL